MTAIKNGDLAILLTNVAGGVQKALGASLSIHGLGFTEYLVLRHLMQAHDHKLRRIDLAEKVGLSASGITRLLNPMEKRGLVSKESAARDARVSLVSLTAAGMRVLEESNVSFAGTAERILSKLDSRQLKSLETIVGKLS